MRIFLSPKPKSSTFQGLHQFIKRLRTFHQLFGYKEEMDEIEREMEIGLPTDVKHVTHIGWDGSTTVNPIKGWDNLKAPEVMSFPTISLRQFEVAMAAQAAPVAPAPLVKDTIVA